ncbi:MAG: 30S ribosomal protein S6 [Clostridiales bacterium]|mgnify:CR=1 FL=1|nr:30S ribosomal protein S6 [Clostridiales bacterium]
MDYELLYIIDTAVEEEPRQELIERYNALIAQHGGKVEKVEEWGKRRLAYLVDDKPEGYYVLLHFSADPVFPKELERNMQIDDKVMRYLVTRVEHKRSNVKPRAQRPAPQAVPAPAPAVTAEIVPDEE